MATGSDDRANLFQLLPSDLLATKQAEEYAKQEGNELEVLTAKVEKMGFWRQFFDSKVAEKDKGYFNFNFGKSDPSKIKEEIDLFLEFYESMLDAAIKVDDKNKTEGEKQNPLIVIINLNEKLTDMFDAATLGLDTTTSRTVTQLYRKFLSKQLQLENKLKKLELIFQKQQFCRETSKLQEQVDNVKKNTGNAAAYKEQGFGQLLETIHFRKKHNEVLQELVKKFDKNNDKDDDKDDQE